MSLKFWSILIPALIITAGGVLIYFDYSSQQGAEELSEFERYHGQQPADHEHTRDTLANQSALPEPDSLQMDRILRIEEEIDQTDNTSLKVAYYGEMIQIYIDSDRLDAAGDAGYRLAELTREADDWINAGDMFYSWLDDEPNESRRYYFAARAAEAYKRAVEQKPDDYELRTDKAAALIAAGEPEQAETELKKALDANEDYLDANYNLGVILYNRGSKDQSISYLKRSVELAQNTERQAMVEQFIEENDITL